MGKGGGEGGGGGERGSHGNIGSGRFDAAAAVEMPFERSREGANAALDCCHGRRLRRGGAGGRQPGEAKLAEGRGEKGATAAV